MNHETVQGVVEPHVLQRLPLFRDLTVRQLKEAAELLELKVVPEGTVLMNQDDPGSVIILIVSGVVKVEVDSPSGPSVLHIGGVGEVFGEMAVVEGQTRFATVTTLTECGICLIQFEAFWTTFWEFPPVPYNLLILQNNRMRRVTSQAEALKHLAPRERVARAMAALFSDLGQNVAEREGTLVVPFVLTDSDFASLTGTGTGEVETLWREWRESGVIEQDPNGHFLCPNLNSLRG